MGVEKKVLKPGQEGKKPKAGQTVTVHCTGFGKDGNLKEKFWSTKDKGQTAFSFKIGVGQVIKGWDEGVIDMNLDEEAELLCSPDYAYGESGFPAWGIQPNSPLLFVVKLLKFE